MSEVEKKDLESSEENSSAPTSKRSSGTPTLCRVFTFISLVIAGGAMTLAIQNNQAIDKAMAHEKNTLQTLQTTVQAQDAQLVKQQLASQSLMANLAELKSSARQDRITPVLMEADYLVRLAYYNAEYSGDPKTVLAFLDRAEQRIASLASPELSEIRSALISNMTALKGVKSVDLEGVLLRINALNTTIADLPLIRSTVKASENSNQQETSATPSSRETWKEKLYNTVSLLKNVIQIQHLSEPVKPLMSVEQHTNLVENIQLKLAIAQWAALHREPAIYKAALEQAKKWVNDYFIQNEMTQAVITGLSELENVDVKPSLPDLKNTVTMIDRVMEAHQQSVVKSSNATISVSESETAAPGLKQEPPVATAPSIESTPAPSKPQEQQPSTPSTKPPSKNGPSGMPAPAPPLKVKPHNPAEPQVRSS